MSDLEGILVVAIEQAVAAPYVSGRLADAGARVIKVEREEGDFARDYDDFVQGESAYFAWLNRGKESICMDLKEPSDKALLERILAKADVFIQNLAPGASERLGFGPDRLRSDYPQLITVTISGYGDEGPYKLEDYVGEVPPPVGRPHEIVFSCKFRQFFFLLHNIFWPSA